MRSVELRFKFGAVAFVWLACLLWSLEPSSAQITYYRVEGIVESAEPELKGVRLLVPWISVAGDTGQLQAQARVVFRNVSRAPIPAFGLMAADDYVLSVASGQRLLAKTRSDALSLVVPTEGLAPTQSNAGLLTFVGLGNLADGGAAKLEVARYAPISVQLVPTRKFVPPPVGKLLPVGQELRSSNAMALVALDVESVIVTPDSKMLVSLAFRNVGRADLKVSTRMSGKDARIVDGELNVWAPDGVSPALESSVTPPSGVFLASAPHSGTVRFPLAHPAAAEQWQFFFPGYERIGAQWNATKGQFDVKVLGAADSGQSSTGAGGELALEEKRFKGIEALLKRMQSFVANGNDRSYLATLPLHLRESHARLLRDRVTVGARGFQFKLPPLQRFKTGADGVVRDVNVLLHYQLSDGVGHHRMVASAVANFAPDKDRWTITDFRFTKAVPFWLLDYVASKQTEHFKIFYQAGTASAERIDKAGRQLEKGYRALKRKGVPVESKGLAIFLDRAEDFARVAGVNADRFDGAAMLHYEKAGDSFEVRNRMIYINDAKFVTAQRLWGMKDRESTITHELVHLYLSKDSRPWVPSWVTEGIAVHFADQYNSWSRRALREHPKFEATTLSELSTRHTLSEGSDDAKTTQAAYLLSGEAFATLKKKFKSKDLLEFYRSFSGYDLKNMRSLLAANGANLSPDEALGIAKVGPILTDILLKQYFDTDLAALDAAAKKSAKKRGF